MTEQDAATKQEQEAGRVVQTFRDRLGVDDELAELLMAEGFTSMEEIAYVPLEEMLAIEGFDEDLVEQLRSRAKDQLLTQAIAQEEKLDGTQPADDLLNMEGMEQHLAYELASRGVITMEDLAEQSIDDLLDIDGMDEDRAGELIMTARKPWFDEAGN